MHPKDARSLLASRDCRSPTGKLKWAWKTGLTLPRCFPERGDRSLLRCAQRRSAWPWLTDSAKKAELAAQFAQSLVELIWLAILNQERPPRAKLLLKYFPVRRLRWLVMGLIETEDVVLWDPLGPRNHL